MKKLLITIDGPSSSGKGTIAKKIATHFDLPCLNSGGLYRATAYLALENNADLESTEQTLPLIDNIDLHDLENPRLHNEEVGKAASIVAKNQAIRDGLFELQRNFTLNEKGAVLEGRDMGTVICPEADYKFFITATAPQRAQRRYKQLIGSGFEANYDNILKQLEERDSQDMSRTSSPLKKADDAIQIDTSLMSVKEVFDKILNVINER